MAGSGFLVDAIDDIKTAITAVGLVPVTDPRNARPLSAFIEAPRFSSFNNNIADITIIVRVLAPPPGNDDALQYLMTKVDAMMGSDLAISAGEPSTAIIGEQQLPAYDLTINLSTRRA